MQTTTTDKNTTQRIQLIVFQLAHQEYAFTIDQIKEVVITPEISKVPLVPSYVKGVANVRGNILAVIDLMERFHLYEKDTNFQGNYLLVVESEDIKIGVLVDDVPGTLTIQSTDIDESPNIIQEETKNNKYIKGIVKKDKRLIILIDVFKVVAKEDVVVS
jgi:purine-binding chemotaxis protein CheW